MIELHQKFEFLINKLENNTFYIQQIVRNATTPPANETAIYDSVGAAKYIIVVVLVYGFGIIFFIGSQVRSTKKVSDEVDEVNAEKILRSMENEIFTKEVLEKLSDQKHRERAWNIYRQGRMRRASASSPASLGGVYSDSILKDIDRDAVENIQKKLKLLNRVQSSYKGQKKGYEVETVNEVLGFKTKRKNGEVDDTEAKKPRSFLRRPFSKLFRKPKMSSQLKAPLLVLQTDDDGLRKLKQSRKMKKKFFIENEQNNSLSKSNQSLNEASNVQSTDISHNDSNSKTSKALSTTSTQSNSNKRRSTSIGFDHCEISEQVTTV